MVLTRPGLLATFSRPLFQRLCVGHPLTTDFSVWYSEGTHFPLGVAAALALYGFRTWLAGSPLLRGAFMQD